MKKLFLCGFVLLFLTVFIPQTTCAAYDFPVLIEELSYKLIISKAIMESPSENIGCTCSQFANLRNNNKLSPQENKKIACRSKSPESRLSDNTLYAGFT